MLKKKHATEMAAASKKLNDTREEVEEELN